MTKLKEIKPSQSLISRRKGSERRDGEEKEMMTDYYKPPN